MFAYGNNVAIMNTITIDSNIYRGAEDYAKRHNVSIKQLVETYLRKILSPEAPDKPALDMPPRLEKLGGCLAGVEDDKDEKLNYLLKKYK